MSAPRGRMVAIVLGAVVAVVAVVFVASTLIHGAHADGCAAELESAIARRDAAYVERAVRNPSIRETLMKAERVETGFVRPMSSEWTRVGLFVKKTATSTSMDAVVLQLSSDSSEGCVFLRDYESGPFGGGER